MEYEEAIKLKPGTPVLIRSKLVSVDVTGDIVYETRAHDQEYEVMNARTDCRYADIQTPEKSKYDPCRLFRKGDKVRVVKRSGRSPILCGAVELGSTYIVYADEEEDDGEVILDVGYGAGGGEAIAWSFLELITPVEELEPYKVWDTTFSFNVGIEDTKAVFYYDANMSTCPYTKEQAKAAAEAECKRLNTKWGNESARSVSENASTATAKEQLNTLAGKEETYTDDSHGINIILVMLLRKDTIKPSQCGAAYKFIKDKLDSEGMWIGDDDHEAERFISFYGDELIEAITNQN